MISTRWSGLGLHHADGPAGEVPELVRAMASDDPEVAGLFGAMAAYNNQRTRHIAAVRAAVVDRFLPLVDEADAGRPPNPHHRTRTSGPSGRETPVRFHPVRLMFGDHTIGTISDVSVDGLWFLGTITLTTYGASLTDFFHSLTNESTDHAQQSLDPQLADEANWWIDEDGQAKPISLPAVYPEDQSVYWRRA